MTRETSNLTQLLEKIDQAAEGRDMVSLSIIMETVGTRSFGPLLLMIGLILFSPLSGIPGIPTSSGLIVAIITIQMLLRKKQLWLPSRLLERSFSPRKILRTTRRLRRPARFIDHGLRPRLTIVFRGPGLYIMAGVCLLISIGMPAMELVPFSATAAGVAFTVFGLSIISRDGLLALLAFGFTALTLGLIAGSIF
ncbi:MAG: exopolysaccharide biosynthesis protein [Desulfosudaceae bacterium]